MSWNPAIEPIYASVGDANAIETQIVPRALDVGNFEVRRALPSAKRQMVGPFVFFDQMGPAESITEQGIEATNEAWAAGDWEHGRFKLPPSDKGEFIQLPD